MSTRRDLLGAGLAMAGAAALHLPSARAADWVRPGMPGWPTDADWAALKRRWAGACRRSPRPISTTRL